VNGGPEHALPGGFMESQGVVTPIPGIYPINSADPNIMHETDEAIMVNDSVVNNVSFNVMPGKQVEEKLIMRRYRVWDDAIEAEFDREFYSSMVKSPDHLIFVTALVHLQKMVYVYMCHYCGLKYDPYGHEVLKVWPTELEISMPKLITRHSNIKHLMKIKSVVEIRPNQFLVTADSSIENRLTINGQAAVIRLKS